MLYDLEPPGFTTDINVTPPDWYVADEDRPWRIAAVTDAVARSAGLAGVTADELQVVAKVPIRPGTDLAALRTKVRGVASKAFAEWSAERAFLRRVRDLLGAGTDAERIVRLEEAMERGAVMPRLPGA